MIKNQVIKAIDHQISLERQDRSQPRTIRVLISPRAHSFQPMKGILINAFARIVYVEDIYANSDLQGYQ